MGYEVDVTIEWERTRPPSSLGADALWGPLEDAFVLRKSYLADGDPAIRITDVVPWDELDSEPRANSHMPPSLFSFSERYCRRPIERATIRILPMVVGPRTPSTLDMPTGTPFIASTRLTMQRTRRPWLGP